MIENWILRIGDANNFIRSSNFNIWGIKSHDINNKEINKTFINKAKKGDRLWFIKAHSNGLIFAFAIFEFNKKRESDNDISYEELGWEGGENWDIEVHYSNLCKISDLNLCSYMKGNTAVRKYSNKNFQIDLEKEFENVIIPRLSEN